MKMGTMRWMCLAVTAASILATTTPASASADYVFLIDSTGTMGRLGWGEPTIEQVKVFVDHLSPGDRISVYRYGEEPSSMLATYPMAVTGEASKTSIKEALRSVFDAERTDMTRGLELAWSERQKVLPGWFGDEADRAERSAYIVVLTDGKLIPVYNDWSKYDQIYRASRTRLLELASLFGDEGVAIHTIGLGPADKVDGDLLRDVAERTGARYHHAASSDAVAGAFSEVTSDIVAARMTTHTPQKTNVAAGNTGTVSSPSSLFDDARADDSAPTGTVVGTPDHRALAPGGALYVTVWQWANAGIALLLGFVALGSYRRKMWAGYFTRPLGRQTVRVRGYLKRVGFDSPGVISARPHVSIENLGLPSIPVGKGARFLNELDETLVEFIGTEDGTPPVLRYVRGSVKVDGEELLTETKLRDGSTIELESSTYVYLRGKRK